MVLAHGKALEGGFSKCIFYSGLRRRVSLEPSSQSFVEATGGTISPRSLQRIRQQLVHLRNLR